MIRKWLVLVAIKVALRRPSPDRIPLSPPRALKNNFFSLSAKNEGEDSDFLVRRENECAYDAIRWSDEGEPVEFSLLKKSINNKTKIRISYFYKGYEFIYGSPLYFIWDLFLGLYKLKIFLGYVRQAIYNRKKLVRYDRMDVLEFMVEQDVRNQNALYGGFALAAELYTRRWIRHPNGHELRRYLTRILESLVISGELREQQGGYRVLPKAYETLSQYQNDVQKHEDAINVGRIANRLTLVVVMVGALNIAVQYSLSG